MHIGSNQILTALERERLGRRATMPEFRACIDQLQAEGAAYLAMDTAVPELPGGYCHDYTCPQHGEFLEFEQGEHRCPVDGRAFRGSIYDAAQRWYVNRELSEGALRLAVLHCINPTTATLRAARRILVGYSERYAAYAAHVHDEENPGVATFTTLDESVWVIPLAWAFTLLAEHLTPSERAVVVSKLFVPAGEHLIARRYPAIHNFTCWHNAAIATIGRVAQRDDFLQFAVGGELGQFSQIEQGLQQDGLWYEGSMSYHFYALWALLLSGLALRYNDETNVLWQPMLRQALVAPLACAYPDGGLPATNDCWKFTSLLGEVCHGVPRASEFYEIGLALYDEPQFAALLHRNYINAPRGFHGLLFGVDEIPREPWHSYGSQLLPSTGMAILRPSRDVQLTLKYGPHGGYHGHPDKLALSGVAANWEFSSDLGTPAYGVESLESWYRQSLSHNTVLIDGQPQPPAHGSLRHFSADAYPQVVDAEVAWSEGVYDGVVMRRAILAQAEYFIDLFLVRRPSPGHIDWIYHNAGAMTPSPGATRLALAGGEAYRHLEDATIAARHGPQTLEWRDGDHGFRLWLYAETAEELVTGSSPANPPTDLRQFVLRRRHAATAAFVGVFQLNDNPLQVSWHAARRLDVSTSDRVDRWTIAIDEDHASYKFKCESESI